MSLLSFPGHKIMVFSVFYNMYMGIASFLLRSYNPNLMDNLKITRTEKTFKAEKGPTRDFLSRKKLNESWGEFLVFW